MNEKCRIRMSVDDYRLLSQHLFPGDQDEHGAVLLAGMSESEGQTTLQVRELHLAEEGTDYVEGKIGYRALHPRFIHRLITRARDERLAYLAVHNHDSQDRVHFSRIDLDSHERGYPALLQISRGMPVGALVFGRRSVQADVWLPEGQRLALADIVIVGNTIERLFSSRDATPRAVSETYDRQVRVFGKAGQEALSNCRVAILGLGGIGSLVAEYLARLGVGHLLLVDSDTIQGTNLSRVVGATTADVGKRTKKVEIARRVILEANETAEVRVIADDVAKASVARQLISYDFLFLAADSMCARLVFNALVHQYLIPGVQLGSKVRCDDDGHLLDVMSVNRPVRPGRGCLWCNHLIDPSLLAIEAKTDEERKAQAYGTDEVNPSVISLNGVAAAHAVNDFMLDYLGLRPEPGLLQYEHFHFLDRTRRLVQPRIDADCSECSRVHGRYGRGDSMSLPCIEG